MRIALVGGSFDPPHAAHVQVVEHLLRSDRFDEVWIVPSPQNPLKPAAAGFEDRLTMCRLAFEPLGGRVQVKEDEGSLSGYTIDLIRHLKQHHPKDEFTFVGGSDLAAQIPRWKDAGKLRTLLNLEFLPRPPDPASPFAAISSTEIRERVGKGLPIVDFTSRPVAEYIGRRGLYRK